MARTARATSCGSVAIRVGRGSSLERIAARLFVQVPTEALTTELARVAGALCAAGYFGPFGLDAYTYRGGDGIVCLQPRSEINARYSMGFALGFGPERA